MGIIKRLAAWKYAYLYPAIFLTTIFFLTYSYHSIHKHQTFNSYAYDLGIFAQLVYLNNQTLFPLNSLHHIIQISVDFAPLLVTLAPIYKIIPYPETLLAIQALVASVSFIPIYLIALNKLKSLFISIVLGVAYLGSPGILSAINFDFHPATLSLLVLSLILYSWYFRKWKIYWFMVMVGLLLKEDISIFILGLGIYQLFRRQIKIGIFNILIAVFSFYLIKYQVMPYIWPDARGLFTNWLIIPLHNPLEVALFFIKDPVIITKILFDSEIKLANSIFLFQQFAYLPFLNPLSWFSVLPYLLIRYSAYGNHIINTALTYDTSHFWSPFWHYNANLEPFLAVGTIFALSWLRLPKYFASFLLIFFMLVNLLVYYQFVWIPLRTKDNKITDHRYIYNSLSLIPKDAAVTAQSSIVPHLANREKIYLFPELYDAEFIVLDKRLDIWPLMPDQYLKQVDYLTHSKFWKIIKQDQSLTILKKASSKPEQKSEGKSID